MITTTFEKCFNAGACTGSYRKMARALGGIKKHGRRTQTPVAKVLDVLGFDDVLWVLHNVVANEESEKLMRLFACDCAERVLALFEQKRPGDNRPRNAVEVARRFANGAATTQELAAARAAARDAARDAARAAARAAAWDAARAAEREWQVNRLRGYLEDDPDKYVTLNGDTP